MIYCEIGLTWKSVALERLKIIQEKEKRLEKCEAALRAYLSLLGSDTCNCAGCIAARAALEGE